jgi:DNA polymerase
MLATTHPSAILRTPDDARDAAYDALVADLRVVAHALA